MDYKVENILIIPTEELWADPTWNCRGEISPYEVAELARSIKESGQDTPINIQTAKDAPEGKKFKILAGHRRYIACVQAKIPTMKCILRDDLDEEGAVTLNLTENIQRKNLTLSQEARAIGKLLNLGHSRSRSYLEKLTGQSAGWLQIRIMLLDLPIECMIAADEGLLTGLDIRNLTTIKALTKDPKIVLEKMLEIKDARAKGTAPPSIEKMVKKAGKHVRGKQEIIEMLTTILNTTGETITTVALAWAAGNVNDLVLHKKIKEEFKDVYNVDYDIPAHLCFESKGDAGVLLQNK